LSLTTTTSLGALFPFMHPLCAVSLCTWIPFAGVSHTAIGGDFLC
jgi:hydrogenase maturation factor HypE